MKYIKKYESRYNPETGKYEYPKEGDYVLMCINVEELKYSDILNHFINNNIGVIYKYEENSIYDDLKVEYFNPPEIIKPWFAKRSDNRFVRTFNIKNMVDFSSSKKDLELKIQMNNFNI